MREIISIHIGQAGIQIANSCWELFCLEHHINPNGEKSDKDGPSPHTLFCEKDSSIYTPRAVMVDTEPTVLDEMRKGKYRNLYNSNNIIEGKQDCSNLFSRGKRESRDKIP